MAITMQKRYKRNHKRKNNVEDSCSIGAKRVTNDSTVNKIREIPIQNGKVYIRDPAYE